MISSSCTSQGEKKDTDDGFLIGLVVLFFFFSFLKSVCWSLTRRHRRPVLILHFLTNRFSTTSMKKEKRGEVCQYVCRRVLETSPKPPPSFGANTEPDQLVVDSIWINQNERPHVKSLADLPNEKKKSSIFDYSANEFDCVFFSCLFFFFLHGKLEVLTLIIVFLCFVSQF